MSSKTYSIHVLADGDTPYIESDHGSLDQAFHTLGIRQSMTMRTGYETKRVYLDTDVLLIADEDLAIYMAVRGDEVIDVADYDDLRAKLSPEATCPSIPV